MGYISGLRHGVAWSGRKSHVLQVLHFPVLLYIPLFDPRIRVRPVRCLRGGGGGGTSFVRPQLLGMALLELQRLRCVRVCVQREVPQIPTSPNQLPGWQAPGPAAWREADIGLEPFMIMDRPPTPNVSNMAMKF